METKFQTYKILVIIVFFSSLGFVSPIMVRYITAWTWDQAVTTSDSLTSEKWNAVADQIKAMRSYLDELNSSNNKVKNALLGFCDESKCSSAHKPAICVAAKCGCETGYTSRKMDSDGFYTCSYNP